VVELIEGRTNSTDDMPPGPSNTDRVKDFEQFLKLDIQPCKDCAWDVIYGRLWVLINLRQQIDHDINKAAEQFNRWAEQADRRDNTQVYNDLRKLYGERRAAIRMWREEEARWVGFRDVFLAAENIAEAEEEAWWTGL
jgi:hypothetical protein